MKDLYLTDAQHLTALKRMRDRISDGSNFTAFDDTTPGNKSTDCSWGMCTNDPNFWAKDELMFPDRGPIRVGCRADGSPVLHESSKYHKDGQQCPFDRRNGTEDQLASGCFYHCRVFSRKRGEPLTQEAALHLYDVTIERLTQKGSE